MIRVASLSHESSRESKSSRVEPSRESVTQSYECSCGSELQVKVVQGGVTNMARIDSTGGS